MKLLACAACLFGAILLGWLIEKVVGRVPQPVDEPLPDLTDLMGIVWRECPSTECAHLEAPHKRVHPALLACCWCFRIVEVPAKGGARRG